MSDSEDSTVTYTELSSPFENLPDIGSPGVDGLPMMPQDPYAYVEAALQAPLSPDYVSGPEHPPSPDYVLEFVPEPVYPEFMPPEDDVLLAEEQPLPVAVSPTADLPGYIPKFDLEEDPKEDPEEDDDDPEEDPADYPTDRDDDDEEEEDEESFGDEVDDEEEDEDEEEEHPASADSVPPHVHRVTARMSVRAQTPISLPSEIEVARLLAIPTPPPSPLSPLAAMIRLRAKAPSTSHPLQSSTPPSGTPPLLPIPLPTSSPPLLLPSTSHKADVLEVTLPPWKRFCIALGPRFKVGESSSAPTARPTRGFREDYGFVGTLDDEIRRDPERKVGYGITNTWDEMVEDMLGTLTTTDVVGLSQRMTDFVMTIRQDTDEIYERLDDVQDDRLLMSCQLKMLRKDRRAHACTTRLMESEAILSCEAWKVAPKRTTRSTPATTTTTTTTPVTNAQLKALIDQGVADALAARDANRSRNGEDNHDSGTGTEGFVELTRWFERMETVFRISNCTVKNQIKFATCTILESALTWWNSHVKIVGPDVAYAMTWTNLKKKMTDKYCLRGEIKKLEVELWKLKVK
nr:reverse transcriptase domain-containing protein [Tanacetum cinerariifolium]